MQLARKSDELARDLATGPCNWPVNLTNWPVFLVELARDLATGPCNWPVNLTNWPIFLVELGFISGIEYEFDRLLQDTYIHTYMCVRKMQDTYESYLAFICEGISYGE